MPVIREKHYSGDNLLAIWKITEPEEELIGQLTLSDAEARHLDEIKAPVRRLHWLAGRLLAANYLCDYRQIIYSPSGKPFIKGATNHFSIAHAGAMAAFTLSKKPTGVDVELITPRVRKIMSRFLSADELKELNDSCTDDTLYIYWCAKEAIIKWSGNPALDFRDHITINPFTKNKETDYISADVHLNGMAAKVDMVYEKFDEYMLVYTI